MTDRDLLSQALDALDAITDKIDGTGFSSSNEFSHCLDTIDALRSELAAPMPEPVAWAMPRADGLVLDVICPDERESYQGAYTVPLYAAPPAAPPATSADYAMGYAEGFNDACKPAPVVREPIIDEMDAVASRYAHKLALDLECVLSDYNGKWWDTAMQTIGEYRMAMNRIHERESPTHMGEPVLPKISSGVGK